MLKISKTPISFLLTNYDKIQLFIIASIVAFLPFYLHISNVFIGLGAFVAVLKIIMLPTRKNFDFLSWIFIGYFSLEALGLLYTSRDNLPEGLSVLEKHQAFILLPLIFFDFSCGTREVRIFLMTFIVSCLIAVMVCITVNMYTGITLYDKYFHEWLFTHERFSEPIGLHPVYLSLYLSMAIFSLSMFYFEGTGSPFNSQNRIILLKKATIILAATLFFVVLVTLGSRTIIVSNLLLAFAFFLTKGIVKKKYSAIFFAAILPVLLIGFILMNPVVKDRFLDLRNLKYENSNYGSFFARLDIWRPGLAVIKENILWGVGTGDQQSELNKKYGEYGFTEGIRLKFNMHNQYLQTALGYGLPGILLLICILVVQARIAFKKNNWLYLAFVCMFMCACATESMLVKNKGTLFLLVFSLIFFNSSNTNSEGRTIIA